MSRIIETLIEEEMRSSYIDYAMSVIVGRALPDARDGLKPVQRRILYAMRDLKLFPDRPFRKCATVVGEVIGKYHPHGDLPIYDALVRMAQDFSFRYPLIEGQGNFGSIDGDPPAAYRYTEARLSKVAVELLNDLDEGTVDFVPNFDGRLKEPVVLPAKFPNLLTNGCSGIAVGMATNIPPHNLGEIADALIYLIDHPDAPVDELLQFVKGPDFPTGGEIIGRSGIVQAYRTGKGKLLVRSKIEFEEKKGRPPSIVIKEIPFQISKSLIIERIAGLVRAKKIEGIADLRDESDREGLRIVIELKKGAQEKVILNRLLKHTPLQVVYGVIMLALVDGEPRILNLKELLQQYVSHREEVVTRRTRYRLEKAEKRAHILEGFLKALDHIDEIIQLIKSSKDPKEARVRLMERFDFTEVQAQAILDMRLHQLTGLERTKIEEEYASLIKDIERYRAILQNRTLLMEVIKEEVQEMKKKFADGRRTEIIEEEPQDIEIEDLIPQEEVVVTLTYEGYIKRTPVRAYRQQGRGGTGKSGITTYETDFPIAVVSSNTHSYLMLFSDRGRVFWLKTYEIPEGGLHAKGRPIFHLISLKKSERILFMIPFDDFLPGRYIFLSTRRGIVKKTDICQFANARKHGVIAVNIGEEDSLIGAVLTGGNDELILAKSSGVAVRFSEKDVRPMGRQARGVKGTRLREGEEVVSLVKVEEGSYLLSLTEKGYGKRFDPGEIRTLKRGGLGVTVQRVNPKTGALVKLGTINGDDDVIILTKKGQVIRLRSDQIKVLGRTAQGVRLMRVKPGDSIIDVAIIRRH